jgi:hypothetical protein
MYIFYFPSKKERIKALIKSPVIIGGTKLNRRKRAAGGESQDAILLDQVISFIKQPAA